MAYFEALADILLDSLKDLALILPVLYITYFLMELLEHIAGDRTLDFLKRSRVFGPLAGGLLGAIPECGIAGGVAGLYAGKVITLGAFVAAVMSTSDEMIPVMISGGKIGSLIAFVGYKLVFGIIAGFIVDFVLRFTGKVKWYELMNDFGLKGRRREICGICTDDSCGCGHDHITDASEGSAEEHCGHKLWLSALIHTLKIGGLIFAVSLLIGAVFELTDSEKLVGTLAGIPVAGELIASLFGLIPNCAVSVTLSSLYIEGVIGAGPMMAGLLTNGGVALLVLFKIRKGKKYLWANLGICALLWALGACGGLLASLIL
ncbi:MAG: arsenic efflux protein [Clostridia bacterium]|nr:arsenic efflux protein [Clostridia bacterium]